MPVVETTLIEGYDAATKLRLMKGMARVVRSVMAANPDGVITVCREVSPSSYARGGVSRVPGPPLPPSTDVVSAFTDALIQGDAAKAATFLSTDFVALDAKGEPLDISALVKSASDRQYTRLDESLNDENVLVFAEGTVGAARFMERYTISGKLISGYSIWINS